MQNIICQQIPSMNHTHFSCNVGDRFKNCVKCFTLFTTVYVYSRKGIHIQRLD